MRMNAYVNVFSSCFDDFQQHLQEVLSKFQSTISSENELWPGPIGIHGIKNENCDFLKFYRKLNFILLLSEIPINIYCRYVKHFDKHLHILLCPIF